MSKLPLYLTTVAAALLAAPAFAVDGTTLINQSTVLAAGGFPYSIAATGSYKLSGNLMAPGTTAINIFATNVTLDLNGFTIGCTGCSGVPGINSTGIGTTIRNGKVNGFVGSSSLPYGINLQATEAKVDHVTVTNNGVGINVGTGVELIVTDSSVTGNTTIGINCATPSTLTLSSSKISTNGLDGVVVSSALITGNTISGNGFAFPNLRGGILVSTFASVTNNLIIGNAVFGIAGTSGATPSVGFGMNSFFGNSVDVSGSATVVSMKNNACSGGVC